jgi:hypothetical protein
MAKFHLEIDGDERFALVLALSTVSYESIGYSECYSECLALMRRLLEVSPLPDSKASASPPAPSGMSVPADTAPATPLSPDPPARSETAGLREESAHPKGWTGELVITPVTVEQSADGKAMVVTYQIRTGNNKVRTTTMRCWDPKLFSALLATAGQSTTFLVKESKGFTNIVGVKR